MLRLMSPRGTASLASPGEVDGGRKRSTCVTEVTVGWKIFDLNTSQCVSGRNFPVACGLAYIPPFVTAETGDRAVSHSDNVGRGSRTNCMLQASTLSISNKVQKALLGML